VALQENEIVFSKGNKLTNPKSEVSLNIRTETFGSYTSSFGRCIFCLKSPPEVTLTDEHIIPFYLTGTKERIIKDGSCSVCNSNANERYEQTTSNTEMLMPRLFLELRRRKRKKTKPLPLVAIGKATNESDFNTLLAIGEYPATLTFLLFEPPGRLSGINRTETGIPAGQIIRSFAVPLFDTNQERPATTTQEWFNHFPFAMSLAKIGYCHAVANLGLDGFDGYDIRALLRGERDDVFNFVGGCREGLSRPNTYFLHQLSTRNEGGAYVVSVGLFTSAGVWPYDVVVGPPARPPSVQASAAEP
jgi:hypothetical protein